MAEDRCPTSTPLICPSAHLLKRAVVTARICHLDRRRLREARKGVIEKTRRRIQILREMRASGTPIEIQRQVEAMLEELTAHGAPYSAVARAVVSDPTAFGL
jgi:hypothetical protein